MSINFENSPAKWNNEGVEPSAEIKNSGFSAGDKPPAAWINWQFNKTYKSIDELQNTVSDIDTEVKTTVPITRGGTGATNVSDAWANMQIYTTVGQLGLTYPCTAVEICNAMPNKSIFITNIEDRQETVTDAPTNWGMLNIIKISSSRKELEFARTLGTDCTRYIGGYSSGDTTVTWKYVPYGTILINQGGTGSTTASGALTNLGAVPTTRTVNAKALSSDITLTYFDVGAASSSHSHSVSDITSGSLPISMGGTGATNADDALTNLGAVPTSRTVNSKALSSDVSLSASDVGAAIYEVKNSTDFNEMKTPGLYTMRSSTTNAPTSGSYHSLIVNKSDTGNYVQQLAIKEGSTQMYIRYGSSSWGAWKKFALSEEVPVHESGTWTPVMEFWGLDQYDGTYTTSNANYFKIGNVVHIQCRVKFTSATVSSHNISLNGLPYVSSGYSAGNFNLNSDAGMQGTDYKSGIFRIAKNNYGTFNKLGTDDIANNRHLTISATYIVS